MTQGGPLSFLRLNNSPRVPSFYGPIVLSAALLLVSIFTEPFWQNFYLIKADSANVTMKMGHWGLCNRMRNTTDFYGPSTFCTSTQSGFNLNFVLNTTGPNQFPLSDNESVLFGTVSNSGIEILTSGQTTLFWLHPIAAIIGFATVVSLACPPRYLGSPESRLFAFQKSGILTILLALIGCIFTFITFFVELAVLISARNNLNDIRGISAGLGNALWFVLPCAILYVPAIASVLLRSTQHNEYQDL
ncbi:hypothetical protein OIO90_002015 [Microbotryomycetes sp. JL221]|nr:hypothetical protein OIO90_002015 [Microbotryomycetes sp. JL221]